jgi:hypothetical protein
LSLRCLWKCIKGKEKAKGERHCEIKRNGKNIYNHHVTRVHQLNNIKKFILPTFYTNT